MRAYSRVFSELRWRRRRVLYAGASRLPSLLQQIASNRPVALPVLITDSAMLSLRLFRAMHLRPGEIDSCAASAARFSRERDLILTRPSYALIT